MNTHASYLTILLLVLAVLSCSRDKDVPEISDITKKDREAIGAFVKQEILFNSQVYPLIVKDHQNGPAFLYIQALYDQITYSLRADLESFSNIRWTKDRHWEVNIFESSNQIAFSIPGGDIYLSDRLIKSLSSSAELYYVLSTEAIIMNKGLLFKELIAEYSTKTLKEIAETGRTDDLRVEGIEEFLPFINYQLQSSSDFNQLIIDHICRTSRFDPEVVQSISDRLSSIDQWISTRPLNLNIELLEVCGKSAGLEAYQNFVLDRL